MQDKSIKYQCFGGNCFQLVEPYRFETSIGPDAPVTMPFIHLDQFGQGVLSPGFAWDGASGPVFQTKSILRAALGHDAKYRLMREGLIDPDKWRSVADKEFYKDLRADGVPMLRADTFYVAVRQWGADNATGGNPIEIAPDNED